MKICYCKGYESLVIPLKFINQGEDIVIYSRSEDIIKFCKYFKIKYIKGEHFSLRKTLFFPFYVKKQLEKSLLPYSLDFSEFHFVHKNTDFIEFILIKIFMDLKCKVFFHNIEIDHEKDEIKDNSLFSNLKAKLFKFNYDIDIGFYNLLGHSMPVFLRKNFDRLPIKVMNYNDKQELFYSVYSNFHSEAMDKCKNLVLFPDRGEFSSLVTLESLDEFIEYLSRSKGIKYKFHPNRTNPENYDCYPSFIPAELITHFVSKNVLSVWTATFRYSIKLDEVNTVSCMDILEWKDSETKKRYKQMLLDWGVECFPQDYEELDNILSEKV